MKKLSILAFTLGIIFLVSCHNRRHSVIITRTNNDETRVDYTGTMAVSNDRTKLLALSNGGYIDFKRANDELYVSADHSGHMHYEVNGAKVDKLDDAGQQMLCEAIGMITKAAAHR